MFLGCQRIKKEKQKIKRQKCLGRGRVVCACGDWRDVRFRVRWSAGCWRSDFFSFTRERLEQNKVEWRRKLLVCCFLSGIFGEFFGFLRFVLFCGFFFRRFRRRIGGEFQGTSWEVSYRVEETLKEGFRCLLSSWTPS